MVVVGITLVVAVADVMLLRLHRVQPVELQVLMLQLLLLLLPVMVELVVLDSKHGLTLITV